jgi:hypothetical protein
MEAHEWVAQDAAWQRIYYAEHGRRPELLAPDPRLFANAQEREQAVRLRAMLCDDPEHKYTDRLLPGGKGLFSYNKCRSCITGRPVLCDATAEEWVAVDAQWQLDQFLAGAPFRLHVPDLDMFRNAEEHAKAVETRCLVCRHAGHQGDRVLRPGEYYVPARCKACQKARTAQDREQDRVVYETAREWFLAQTTEFVEGVHVDKKSKYSTTVYCPKPKGSQFADTEAFEDATRLWREHNKKYRKEIRES